MLHTDASFPYLNWLPPQDEEVLRSHHHEAHELMAENLLDLIRLQGKGSFQR
jgi:hypothetical protein